MKKIIEHLQKFINIKQIPAGLYHYQSPPNNTQNFRLHLRLENHGEGILIINASTILHLNRTAAEMAYYLINQYPKEDAIKNITRRYKVTKSQAENDYQAMLDKIDILVSTPDLDPIAYLDINRKIPYSDTISAPYRLDCAITYRSSQNVENIYAPTKNVTRELSLEEWRKIIDVAWLAGIPHIIFTGGEPTLRDDLIELLKHAENNGQVTGILTNGLRLNDKAYRDNLFSTGVDHLLILLDHNNPDSWKALETSIIEDLFVVAHLTITKSIIPEIEPILQKLSDIKTNAVSLSASDKSITENILSAREFAANLNLPLIWDLPVPFSKYNPVSLGLLPDEIIEGAGKGWLYVEPDGDILLSQGMEQKMGNILTDKWEHIWKSVRIAIDKKNGMA